MTSFYNTNAESGDQLRKSCIHAMAEQDQILSFFRSNPRRLFNPADVHERLSHILFGNIKRAMTNLTEAGYLVKTELRTMGKYGKMNFNWRLNADYKMEQRGLF